METDDLTGHILLIESIYIILLCYFSAAALLSYTTKSKIPINYMIVEVSYDVY